MNETDVREAVVVPLLESLGYATGTEFDIIREQALRYPQQFLGRKKPAKDPALRGRADYILQVRERVRWVLEVKGPNEPLNVDAAEQAYTYASHAEIRAVYFVLANGPELVVYAVSSGPDVPPVLRLRYEELAERFADLLNVLGPEAVERDFPDAGELTSPPLGPGLRSTARVLSGVMEYKRSTMPGTDSVLQLRMFIVNGFVQRNDAGKIVAFLETESSIRDHQQLSEQLGLHAFELLCEQPSLSIDPDRPSHFACTLTATFPPNTEMLDINTWKKVSVPFAIRFTTEVSAAGVLEGNTFAGVFRTFVTLGLQFPSATLEGSFSLRLG